MLKNDISNRCATRIAIQINDLLLKEKEGLLVKINPFSEKYYLDEEVLSLINFLFKKTDCLVDLILFTENIPNKIKDLVKIKDLIVEVPYANIICIQKPTQLTSKLNIGSLDFVIVSNEYKSLVGHKYCMNLEEFNKFFRRGIS